MKTRDFLVGLTFFGLLAVLAALTIFLADFSFGPGYRLSIPFTDVGGLNEGAEVRIDGLMVGRVRGMERRPGKSGIFVILAFEEDPDLPDGATYAITSASALGGRVVEIWTDSLNGIGRHAPDGQTWRGPGPNAMDAITKLVRDNEDRIQKAIGNIESITASLAEPGDDGRTLAEQIRGTVDNLEMVSAGLKEGNGLIGRLLTDPTLSEDAAATVANARKISGELADEEGPLLKLATDPELADQVKEVVANIRDVSTWVKEGQGVVRMLLTDEDLRDNVRVGVLALKQVAEKLAGGKTVLEGVLGDDAKALTQALVSLGAAARRIEMATANLEQKNNIIGMLLTDSEAAKEVRNSIRSLSDFIETTRENAPITTFAGILLSPF